MWYEIGKIAPTLHFPSALWRIQSLSAHCKLFCQKLAVCLLPNADESQRKNSAAKEPNSFPKELVDPKLELKDETMMSLCVTGCPMRQLLANMFSIATAAGDDMSVGLQLRPKCSKKKRINICVA